MSWITDYVRVIDPVSEAPMNFNLWAAMSLVGSVLKNNIWISYRTFTIYPNQYIVFIAPPGIGKGEAIYPTIEIADSYKMVNYISDRVTAPRILEKLNIGFLTAPAVANGQVVASVKDSSATLKSTELSVLLTSSDWMLDFLCDAWDQGKYDYDTKNKGSFTVSGMCVSLIGGCVPDYIRKLNKDASATVNSGFSARTLFINATQKSKQLAWGSNPTLDPLFKFNMKVLTDRLLKISQLKGEYTLEPAAVPIWDAFYKKLLLGSTQDDSDAFKNFKARQNVHVLKTAMILTAASGSMSRVISEQILLKAINMIESIAEGVDDIFRSVGESDISAGLARMQLYLERKGQVLRNELISDNMRFINPEDIQRVLSVLETIGFMRVKNGGSTVLYEHTGMPIRRGRP